MTNPMDRRPVCPSCFEEHGEPGGDCLLCNALNGRLNQDALAPGSFLGVMNQVGGRASMGPDERARMEERIREQVREEMRAELAARQEREAEHTAAQVQGMTEGVQIPQERKVEFQGKHFRIADKVGLMPLMEFAYHANSGMDTGDMGALAAIFKMLKDCLHEDEWDGFREHATAVKADEEDLMPVIQQTIEMLTARPTQQVSGSLPKRQGTSGTSTDTFSARPEGLIPVSELGKVV